MQWRYIPPLSAPGEIQMAIDTWLFEQCRLGLHPPTLRFYGWPPASLSLGHFQKHWPPHWNTLHWQGRQLSLVRRPSGGRGVLHHGDLTYSFTLPMPNISRREAYISLCQFLIAGWQTLGLNLQFGQAGRGYHREANCFRLATGADLITEAGLKFIGSAQLWRGNVVLQHGSMRIAPSSELHHLVFPEEPPLEKALPEAIASLSLTEVIATLKESFQTALQVQLSSAPLTQSEWQAIMAHCPPKPTPSGGT